MSSIFTMDVDPRNVICLDTEFTGLHSPELLSLGLSSGSGNEHYAELDLESAEGAGALSRCSDFVREGGVIEQWGLVANCAGSYAEMARRTADWLSAEASRIVARTGQPALLAFDCITDWELLVRLLRPGGRSEVLRSMLKPLNVSELRERLEPSLAMDAAHGALLRRGLDRHHALADVIALRAALHVGLTGKRLIF